ncbi:hypothetical protein CBR_g48242 [Chara braunii]|uniref:Reverse transcriptase domain-containing protein n=1 Tax=Chara braunii TaxID=69332 RepID=A0A388M2L6_CHABU|nr:hypothetical protein CBR_g48242 [Chara braunii]|eukprot:GBG88713.1 hypothetical protein CBR_g48242 [Chara braunii]
MVATFKEHLEQENRKNEEKQRRRQEREEQARIEEEEQRRAEERRMQEEKAARKLEEVKLAKELRAEQKLKKKKQEEEERAEFAKSLHIHVAMCMGGMREEMRDQFKHGMAMMQSSLRNKEKVASPAKSEESFTSGWVVRVKTSEEGQWRIGIRDELNRMEKQGIRRLTLYSAGGNSWADGWRKVKSAYGRSAVRKKGRDTSLAKCKKVIDDGGVLEIRHLRRWCPSIGPDRKALIKLLRNPNKMNVIRELHVEGRLRWYKATKDFQKKTIRSYLRRIIVRVIRETSGWKMGADIVVKVKYDERVSLAEVRKVVNDKIGGLSHPVCMRKHARSKVRTELDGVHPMLLNAGNVLKARHPDRVELLRKEIVEAFGMWGNHKKEDVVEVTRDNALKCMAGHTEDGANFLDIAEVQRLKMKLRDLVLTPLDRNPGETLVMCPHLYFEAMMEGFVMNTGYEVLSEQGEDRVKEEKSRCVQQGACDEDMFSKLPHEEIMKSVDWIIDRYKENGKNWIRVNTRGKGCTFGRTTGADHWRMMGLEEIRSFVKVDLEHTYMKATGVLLKQMVGIPMGKSTSPPLACIMCAYYEFKFLNPLGHRRKMVTGLRLMDDVSIMISATSKKARIVDKIRADFEQCYPPELQLKRTDEGTGTWDFLGLDVRLTQDYPFLGCMQMTKNEDAVWNGGKLAIKNGQFYDSWGSKQQKGAVLASYLHRIDANTTIRSEIL